MSGVMDAEHPVLPWHLGTVSKEAAERAIDYLEQATRPLAEALAACVRFGRNERVNDAVVETFQLLGREPFLRSGTWSSAMPSLRVYPLVLCLYTFTATVAVVGHGSLLRRILDIQMLVGRGHLDEQMAVAQEVLHGAEGYFEAASAERSVLPIAARLSNLIPSWCSPFVVGASPREAFFVSEFALALAYLDARSAESGRALPFPGIYLYLPDASDAISRMLRRRPAWFEEVFPGNIPQLLGEFDEFSKRAVDPHGFANGLTKGALAAWERTPKK